MLPVIWENIHIFVYRKPYNIFTHPKTNTVSNFYHINQNNSGGRFIVDDKVCNNLIIEADNHDAAVRIAENIGVYWNGVEEGTDCPCCGDRWYGIEQVDLDSINKWGGYNYTVYYEDDQDGGEVIESIKSRYPNSRWSEELRAIGGRAKGRIMMDDIEQYAQVVSDMNGWTSPDCRIFYKDGTVKEVFSPEVEKNKSFRQK